MTAYTREPISVGACPDCGHYPTQFIQLSDGRDVFALHLPKEWSDDCATASARRLAQRFQALYREWERACGSHQRAAEARIRAEDHSRDLIRELKAADTIIRNALNLMSTEQKRRWHECNVKGGAIGDEGGVTRFHERRAALAKAQGEQQ